MEQMDPERVKRIAIAEMKLVEIQVIQMESQKIICIGVKYRGCNRAPNL